MNARKNAGYKNMKFVSGRKKWAKKFAHRRARRIKIDYDG